MNKPEEVMILRNGKPVFAVKLRISQKNKDRDTYMYLNNGQIEFNADMWSKDLDCFEPGNESHIIAKEIFVTQLRTTIRNKILELKQLESLFCELKMENYLGTVLSDSQPLLTDVKRLVELNADAIAKIESQIIDAEGIKNITENVVKETVKPLARKKMKNSVGCSEEEYTTVRGKYE